MYVEISGIDYETVKRLKDGIPREKVLLSNFIQTLICFDETIKWFFSLFSYIWCKQQKFANESMPKKKSSCFLVLTKVQKSKQLCHNCWT